jgi:aspartyl aminopeptidase
MMTAHGMVLNTMPPMTKIAEHLPLVKKAMSFFDDSSDPFHAVQSSIKMLTQAGFEELTDVDPYKGNLRPGQFLFCW